MTFEEWCKNNLQEEVEGHFYKSELLELWNTAYAEGLKRAEEIAKGIYPSPESDDYNCGVLEEQKLIADAIRMERALLTNERREREGKNDEQG